MERRRIIPQHIMGFISQVLSEENFCVLYEAEKPRMAVWAGQPEFPIAPNLRKNTCPITNFANLGMMMMMMMMKRRQNPQRAEDFTAAVLGSIHVKTL